jgi:predicted N-acetyltransferase YhbS
VGKKSDIHIRLAEEGDKSQILKLLNQVFSQQQHTRFERGESFWNWKYETSPFGESSIMVAVDEENIVAVGNLWPWEFSCRATMIKALQPCDSVVHPNYQGRGLFSRMRMQGINLAKSLDYNLIFNFPNEQSLPAYLSLGWTYVGKIEWWVKILKPINLIKGKFSSVQIVAEKIDEKYAIDPVKLNRISSYAENFDNYIKINHSVEYFNWRFVQHYNRMYGMVSAGEGRHECCAVFAVNKKGNSREMVVMELIGKPGLTKPLIDIIVDTGKEIDVDFIALMKDERAIPEGLWKYGFVRKKLKNMVVLPLDINLEKHVTMFKNWSMRASLHDSI